MTDETNINEEMAWFYKQRAREVVENLRKRNISAQYVSSRQEALSALLETIPPEVVVARGDSITLEQVGILSELRKRNQNRLLDPFATDAKGNFVDETEERRRIQREALLADVFLTGTNAITLDGKLVNVDAVGGRVAAMIFGPKRVIVVAGANKIVKDVGAALERIRGFAAPVNAKRHALKHHRAELGELPCAKTGVCVDCNHDWRICRYTVIIEGAMIEQKGRIHVVLIGEKLGI